MKLPNYTEEHQEILCAIDRVCSVFAVPATSDTDARTHIKGTIEGQAATFLVDIGAGISYLSEDMFQTIPGSWSLEEVQPEPNFRITTVLGQPIPLLGQYMFDMEIIIIIISWFNVLAMLNQYCN